MGRGGRGQGHKDHQGQRRLKRVWGGQIDAVIHAPLAVRIAGNALCMTFSIAWAGPIASLPVELGPVVRLRCRVRFAVLDYNSYAALLLIPERDPARAPDLCLHEAAEKAPVSVAFLCQGGGEAVNNIVLAGKSFEQASIDRNVHHPSFLTGETYKLDVGIDTKSVACDLRPTSPAARDYAPALRTAGPGNGISPGAYRLVFWASPRYPRLAVMEVGALSIEGGQVLPAPADGPQAARRAFCASRFAEAVSLYDARARIENLDAEDEDALAFARVRTGAPLDSAWLDAALGRLPNCERLLRLWAGDRLRCGDTAALFRKAESLSDENAPGSPRLVELLEELAENAPPRN